MAAAGHLSGGRLNLTLLREAAREELKAVLGDEKQKKVTLTDSQRARTVMACTLTGHSVGRISDQTRWPHC